MNREQLDAYIRARIVEDGECWIWQQRIDRNHVPIANVDKRGPRNLRRTIWEVYNPGEVQGKRVATTSCGVRGCVNPDHVVVRPLKMAQRAAAKRGAYSQPKAIAARTRAMQQISPLTPHLNTIREMIAAGHPSKDIASVVGCSASAIRRFRVGASHRPVIAGASVFAWRGNINL